MSAVKRRKAPGKGRHTVADFCAAMESIAPVGLAQEWDNVGLIAGDPAAPLRRVLLCIDLTPEVVAEAVASKAGVVMAYHPPIFRAVGSIRADSAGAESCVLRCIQNGIAVYSTHTALDAAEGGTNDVMAELCGIKQSEPLEYVGEPGVKQYKLAVYVPVPEVETVAEAMFAAGAGHIGEYSHCSNRIECKGSFLGGESTSPTIGERGRLEYVDEIRLEAVVPSRALAGVVAAMVKAHSYEEPAYDIYPLEARPVRGIGRVGRLPRAVSLSSLAKKLKRAIGAQCVMMVGEAERQVERAVIVVGAAGRLPFRMKLGPSDVIVTGELRHHDALTIKRLGASAIALGHWSSERPVLGALSERLAGQLQEATFNVSRADAEPFTQG